MNKPPICRFITQGRICGKPAAFKRVIPVCKRCSPQRRYPEDYFCREHAAIASNWTGKLEPINPS